MKFYKLLIAIVLVCSTQAVSAQDFSNSCSYDSCCEQDSCCSNFDFSVYGDFLWWKVCRSELDFTPNGTTHYVSPEYDSGYRIGGSAQCRCLDFGVRYTSYQTGKSRTNPENSEESEHIKYHFDYDVVDVEFGFNFNIDCACGTIRPFAGVKFAQIEEKLDLEQFNNDIFKLKFDGTGLYIGAEGKINAYTWQSCDCCWNVPINIVARASTGILDGKFKHHAIGTGERKDECLFIPVTELFVAAEFELSGCTSCFNPKLVLGYEVQSWGWRERYSEDDIANLGLGGMVLGLEADF